MVELNQCASLAVGDFSASGNGERPARVELLTCRPPAVGNVSGPLRDIDTRKNHSPGMSPFLLLNVLEFAVILSQLPLLMCYLTSDAI